MLHIILIGVIIDPSYRCNLISLAACVSQMLFKPEEGWYIIPIPLDLTAIA